MRSKFKWIYVLLIAFIFQFSYAQEKTISGTITEAGLPLPGVTVLVKGTTRGTQSDFDGKYSIKAKQGEILEFSYIGMKKQSLTVGSSNVLNVVMEEDAFALGEVVITSSYSTESKQKVTGAVSVVKAATIENKAFASFDQILQGQAAGVTVSSGSGQPGAASKVRIRGTSSISAGNDPLYILDGVPIAAADFAALNPNDFENVSVLKDASATSIYGSRSSAGVIVITSKKGRFNEKTQFTYRSQFGITEIGDPKFEMMNSEQLLNFQRLVGNGRGVGLSDEEIAVLAQTNTNWSDLFFRTGVTKSHELSARGGGEKVRYFTSINYFDQEGIAQRSDLKRFTLRTNVDVKASDKTSFGYNLSLGFTKQNLIDSENSVTLQNPYAAAYLGSPYDAPFNDDGTYAVGAGLIGPNAYENLLENQRYNNQVKIVGNIFGETEVAKYLTARVDFGVDYTNDYFVRAQDPSTFYGSTVTPGNAGLYGQTNSYRGRFNTTTRLVYNRTFNEKHDLEVGAYMEYFKDHFKSGAFVGYGINPSLVGYPSGITPGSTANGLVPTVGGSEIESGIFSYFGVAKYGYDDRFKLDLSIRRDASNRFAEANKWGTFWSVGANWNIINENFMEGNKLFRDLKLRASYGTSGNQSGIGDFQQFATWGTTQYGGAPGTAQISIPNPNLQWEEGNKANIGLDFALFNNSRIIGTVEFYKNITSKLLIDQQLPYESGTPGGGLLTVNAGEMSNTGIDLSLEGFLIKNKNTSFSLYANFNYNKNNIEDLGQVSEFIQGTAIVREGLPFGSHFAVGWAGVNPANGQPLYYDLDGNVTNQFSEANSTANWGTYEPVYSGGFGHRFSYKGFDCSTLFTFAADYYRYNNQTFFQENPNFAQYNLTTNMLTMWQNPGDITEIQSFEYNREFSSKDIEDASYVRLRNIEIGYSLSPKVIEQIKFVDGFRVYLQAQNMFTWTKFTGFDPEDDNNIAQYEYPTPRIFTFGVDVKF